MDSNRKLLPPHYFLTCVIAMFLLDRYLPLLSVDLAGARWVGAIPMAAGLAITLGSAGLFRKAGTPVKPFAQSTAVVTGGMYRITRNPMYLGLVLMLLGLGALLASAGAFAPIPLFVAIIHFEFIKNEERFMEGLFGEEYLAYKRRVRRWI